MKFLYALLLLASITISDVFQHALVLNDQELSMVDNSTESESENEKESETKKDSKLHNSASFFLSSPLLGISTDLESQGNLIKSNPHQEIHSPPPD